MSLLQLSANLSAVFSAYGVAYKFFTTIDRVPESDTDAQDGEIPSCIGERPLLKILSGQTVAFVGPPGFGKSTTVQLVQKFFGSLGGTVTLGGHDLKSLNVKWLRQNNSVVGKSYIVDKQEISTKKIRARASLTQHEYSLQPRRRELTDLSYQEIITAADEPGGMLSGGQKQRIAIVRALVRKPKLLLLDEEALNNILEEDGFTMITIAHRLLTIQNANLICVANDGRIIEQGTHWELLSLEGIYAKLVKKQSLVSCKPFLLSLLIPHRKLGHHRAVILELYFIHHEYLKSTL